MRSTQDWCGGPQKYMRREFPGACQRLTHKIACQQLVLANNATIALVAQSAIGLVINVFAQELHATIAEHHKATTHMSAAEAHVLLVVGWGGPGGCWRVDFLSGVGPLEVPGKRGTVVHALTTTFANHHRIAGPVRAVTDAAAPDATTAEHPGVMAGRGTVPVATGSGTPVWCPQGRTVRSSTVGVLRARAGSVAFDLVVAELIESGTIDPPQAIRKRIAGALLVLHWFGQECIVGRVVVARIVVAVVDLEVDLVVQGRVVHVRQDELVPRVCRDPLRLSTAGVREASRGVVIVVQCQTQLLEVVGAL